MYSFNNFLLESNKSNELTNILKNLDKDEKFLKYLHDKGKTKIVKIDKVLLSMGLCTYVAKYIEEIYNIGKALGSHGPIDAPVFHAFIFYKNKYYDAISVNGVNNVWELWNFDDASYSTQLDEEQYKKEIIKNIHTFELNNK